MSAAELESHAGQQRTALVSVLAAVVLVALKLGAGLASGSLGLVAEALHSGTDLVAALLTLFAIRVAVRPPDSEHQYGHGKAEHLAALAEAAFLVLASLFIGWQALRALTGADGHVVDAAWYTLVVLVLVIAIDISRATISLRAARRYDSPALASNALHFGGDLLGSVAVLIGLLAVRAGFAQGDAIAALVVAVLVIAAAIRLARGNVEVLMDRVPAAAAASAQAAIERDAPGVEVRRLRVREAAGSYFVDAVIGIRPDAAVAQGHAAADAVEAAIRRDLPRSDVVVHVEPGEAHGVRERVHAAASGVARVHEVHNVRVLTVGGCPEVTLHLKLPPAMSLDEAHHVATEVEAAIRAAEPELAVIHTHIEPLAGERDGAEPSAADTGDEQEAITSVVRERTGAAPEGLRLRRREDGRLVALLTVSVPAGTALAAAHEVASEVEREVRRRAPAIADVVVHTEPR